MVLVLETVALVAWVLLTLAAVVFVMADRRPYEDWSSVDTTPYLEGVELPEAQTEGLFEDA